MQQKQVMTNPKSQIQLLIFYIFYLPVLHHPYLSVFFVAGEAQRAEHLHGRHHQQQDYKFNSLHLTPKAGGLKKAINNKFVPDVETHNNLPRVFYFFCALRYYVHCSYKVLVLAPPPPPTLY